MSFAALRSPTWRRTPPWREPVEGGYQRPDPALWTPQLLPGLRALYDAELGQPKHVGYVQLDGTSGDYIYTPDSAATSFDNDIEVVMRVRVTDWSAAAIQTLVGKYLPTGNQRSWRFYTNTAGNIGLTASADGTSVTTVTVTPTNPLPDDTWIWIRPRLDLTNGANSVGTIDTAADTGSNALVPISWTANGSATGATIAGVFDGTGSTEIGSFTNGTAERLSGRVGRCIVKSGFDGTTVADFNADDCYGDGYWHADGYRWNLGLPKIYDRGPNGLAPATFGSGSNQPRWLPWAGLAGAHLPGVSGNNVRTGALAADNITIARNAFDGRSLRVRTTFSAPDSSSASRKDVGSFWSHGYVLYFTPSTRLLEIFTNVAGVSRTGSVTLTLAPVYYVQVEQSGNDFVFSQSLNDGASYSVLGSTSLPGPPDAATASEVTIGVHQFSGVTTQHRLELAAAGVPFALFDASLCGQSGYVDAYGNTWTVNRATSGRKTVVQSPAARDAASSAVLGTDDVIIGPAAAVPSAPSEWSIVWVGRRHESADDWAMLMSTGNNAASTTEGAAIFDFGSGTDQLSAMAHDGSTVTSFNSFPQDIDRSKQAVVTLTGTASDLTFAVNGGPQAAVSAPGGVVNMTTLLIGRAADGGYSDQQWRAAVVVDRVLTTAEHGLLVAYYGGGL